MLSKNEIEYIKEFYGTIKAIDIANKLSISLDRVYYYAKKFKLKGDQGINRKYSCNNLFFHEPNIINSFWAGFLAADGCITNEYIRIMLSIKDHDMLEKFRKDIEYTGHLYISDFYQRCSLEFRSDQIINDLKEKWSIIPRKSLILQPPSINLNNSCMWSFLHGNINGDGSIYREKNNYLRLSFLGTKYFLIWIQNFIGVNSGLTQIGNIFKLRYSGKNALYVANQCLKVNVPYKLKRKWDII